MNPSDYYGKWHHLSGGIITRSVLADHSSDENFVMLVTDDSAPILKQIPDLVRGLQCAMLTILAVTDRDVVADWNLVLARLPEIELSQIPNLAEVVRECEEESRPALRSLYDLVVASQSARGAIELAKAGDTPPNFRGVARQICGALAMADHWRFGNLLAKLS